MTRSSDISISDSQCINIVRSTMSAVSMAKWLFDVYQNTCVLLSFRGDDQLKKVKNFTNKRAEQDQLKDQLHVIWCAETLRYCANF